MGRLGISNRSISRWRGIAILAAGLFNLAETASAEEASAASGAAQANNPLANFTAFNIHNYYICELTGTDAYADQLWLRYAQPF